MKYIENLLDKVTSFLPGIVGALVILLIGWLIASGVSRLVKKVIQRIKLGDKLEKSGYQEMNLDKTISRLVYYVLMVLVFLLVLEALGLRNVLDPLKNMVNEFFGFLPNLVAAVLIGLAGYVIASVVSEMIGLAGNFLDSFSTRFKIDKINIAKIAKQLVFIFIFVPILIAALDTLKVEAISEPATEMLTTFITSVPNIISAALIISIFYIGGTYITQALKELLINLKMDELSKRLNLTGVIGEKQTLSQILSGIAFFFIMFSGIVTAVEKLEFVQLADTLNNLLTVAGQIFLGLVVLALGNFISKVAHKAVDQSESNTFLASLVRVTTLGLFLAIALRTMGIANEIVNLAFGLTLGSVAVAVALSFGLGGREAAGRQMEIILNKFKTSNSDNENSKEKEAGTN